MILVVGAVGLAVLLALAAGKSGLMPGRALTLLRVLFPSWRFFDELGHAPELSYRLRRGDSVFGPWLKCLDPPRRRWGMFLLNAEGNLNMACQSLVDQLDTEIEDLEDSAEGLLPESLSYRLTENLVRNRILARDPSARGARFQFKLDSALQGSPEEKIEELLVSLEHEV